jgi:hypothetical protein
MPIELAPPRLEESLAPRESLVIAPIAEASAETSPAESGNASSDPAGIEFIAAIIVVFVLYGFSRLLIASLAYIMGLGILGLIGYFLI